MKTFTEITIKSVRSDRKITNRIHQTYKRQINSNGMASAIPKPFNMIYHLIKILHTSMEWKRRRWIFRKNVIIQWLVISFHVCHRMGALDFIGCWRLLCGSTNYYYLQEIVANRNYWLRMRHWRRNELSMELSIQHCDCVTMKLFWNHLRFSLFPSRFV